MQKIRDLSGQRFGYLVAESYERRGKGKPPLWTCRCDCGNLKKVPRNNLTRGQSRSCGCIRNRSGYETHGFTKHGERPPEYRAWANMLSRCRNPSNPQYFRYGARGISVCDRWTKFSNFIADVGSRPGAEYQIDRIDNDGNYEPKNVRWATPRQNSNNRRTRREFTFDGRTQSLAEWAREAALPDDTVGRRLDRGWSPKEAVTGAPGQYRVQTVWMSPISISGKSMSVHEWSRVTGLAVGTIKARVRRGWSVERAIKTPVAMRQGGRP